MMQTVDEWGDLFEMLSGVERERCRSMISDLTCGPKTVALQVHPFVALDAAGGTLALAPPFPLHSQHEENILRVCAKKRPDIYGIVSSTKEDDTRATLMARGGPHRLVGQVSLPNPVPDIDFMAVDETNSCVVVAELKWISKPVLPLDATERDNDVLKGVRQLGDIRKYLGDVPVAVEI
jgi:hypothetical protein